MLDTFCESLNKIKLVDFGFLAEKVFLKVALCDLGRLRAASFFAKIQQVRHHNHKFQKEKHQALK